MYKTHQIHKNKTDASYITIGDNYIDPNRGVPPRWKQKQFMIKHHPNGDASGCFAKKTYQPDKYTEAEQYRKTQPVESRKQGFGSKDASKRAEFTAAIRTEQYRETLKKELRMVNSSRNPEVEAAVLQQAQTKAMSRTFPEGLNETQHLYDIGRNNVTDFDPKASRDTFYTMRKDRPKRLGIHETMSMHIGNGAWDHSYSKPEYGPIPYVKNFYDKSHLGTEGF